MCDSSTCRETLWPLNASKKIEGNRTVQSAQETNYLVSSCKMTEYIMFLLAPYISQLGCQVIHLLRPRTTVFIVVATN
jgi:hypothetical protein